MIRTIPECPCVCAADKSFAAEATDCRPHVAGRAANLRLELLLLLQLTWLLTWLLIA